MYTDTTLADHVASVRRSDSYQTSQAALAELASEARSLDIEFRETERTPIECFKVTENELIVGAISVAMDQEARNRLLAGVAPITYLRKRSIGLQTATINEHLQLGDLGTVPKLVLRRGEFHSIRRGDLIELGHSELLSAITDSLGKSADDLTVAKIDREGGQLELELVSSVKAREIRRGDVVKAGLYITHSRYSDQATQIQAFVYRLVCENGMMRRECVSTAGIVRIRRLPTDFPNGRELLLDQVRRLTRRTWENLEPQLQELQATAERRADVKQLLKQWLQRARISTRAGDHAETSSARTLMDRVLTAWRDEGSENTYWAAVNALTRVGTHDLELSPRQRRVLGVLAGLLAFSGAHLCPRCFSVLSEHSHGAEPPAITYSQHE